MMRILYSFLLCCVILPMANGQELSDWRHWSRQHGLHSQYVSGTEPNGDLWLSGRWSVDRFDGYAGQHFELPDTSSRVYVDDTARVWAFQLNESRVITGVQVLDRENGSWLPVDVPGTEAYEYSPRQPRGEEPSRKITLSGQAFYCIDKRTLRCFDLNRREWFELKSASGTGLERFTHVANDRDGSVWIGGLRGFAKWEVPDAAEPTRGCWTEYLYPKSWQVVHTCWLAFERDAEGSDLVYAFPWKRGARDKEKTVVRLEGNSLQLLDWDLGPDWHGFPLIDQSKRLWLLRWGKTRTYLSVVSKNGNVREINAPGTEFHYRLVKDTQENIFYCGYRGLYSYAQPVWSSPLLDEGPKIQQYAVTSIKNIREDSLGRVWFLGEGVLLVNDGDTWKHYLLPEGWVPHLGWSDSLGALADGRITINAAHAESDLLLFDPERETFEALKHPNGAIAVTTPRHDGKLWVLTYDGGYWKDTRDWRIEIYDGKTFTPCFGRRWEFSLSALAKMKGRKNGELWFNSWKGKGLSYYDGREHQVFDRVGNATGSAAILFERDDETMWAGTTKGIYAFKQREWQPVPEEPPMGTWEMCLDPDGTLWATSDTEGARAYRHGEWVSTSVEEGLPSEGVHAVFTDSRGRVWAGTDRGIALYQGHTDTDPPRATVSREENLTSYPPRQSVRILFSGIDRWQRTATERLLYSHRWDEGDWGEFTGETYAVHEGLEPGEHEFEVRVMDRSGNLSEKPATYSFTVQPFWYQETGFLLIVTLCAIVIVVLLGIAISRHIRLAHAYLDIRTAQGKVESANLQLQTSNEELHTANEQLLELDKMKSSFVSQASHDLRTPLTAIKGSLDNLMRGIGGGLNDRQKRVMDRALRSVDRLTALINDVLDVNRLESGRMVLETARVQFEALVQSILHENQPAAEQKKIAIATEGLDGSYPIDIDTGKMERVVGELIGNAIKYTSESGEVFVSLKKETGKIFFSVRDTGIGLTPEETRKIFERFFRTQVSQHMAKGSGLGLSIAKELIELHGGKLTVESEQGQGTTFTMTLPVGEAT